MKKQLCSFLCSILCILGTVPVFANTTDYYDDTFFSTPLPLLYQSEEKDCKIYGVKSSGVVVCFGEESKFFDWQWQNSIYELPQVIFADFDEDKKEELCFISNLYAGSGTSTRALHILDMEQSNFETIWTERTFTEETLKKQLEKQIAFYYANHTITIKTNHQKRYAAIYPQKQMDNITLLYPELIVENQQIKVIFSIGAFYDGRVIPDILENKIIAAIVYENGGYQISQVQIQ